MKRIFGISLISLSVSILLLHSFVPHHHSAEDFNLSEILNNEPVQTPIDLLKVGFHINLGNNHLQDFQICQSVVADGKALNKQVKKLRQAIIIKLGALRFSPFHEKKFFLVQEASTFKSLFKRTFSYRGPPILS